MKIMKLRVFSLKTKSVVKFFLAILGLPVDWEKRGLAKAGFLDLDFIQIVKSLNFHPGYLVDLVLDFLCLKFLDKLYLTKELCFNALNLVLGRHMRE